MCASSMMSLAHFVNSVRYHLDTAFWVVGLVMGDKFIAWALRSPYLVPHDVFFWGHFRSPIYEEPLKT